MADTKTVYQLCQEAIESVCLDAGLIAAHERKLSKAAYCGTYEVTIGDGEIPEHDATCHARKIFTVEAVCRIHCGGNVGKAKIDAYVLRSKLDRALCRIEAPEGVAKIGIPIRMSRVEYNEDGAEFVATVTAEVFEGLT
jgi:hypothetical protein